MFKKYQHIHFVGIGGIGMSGIAEVLLTLGYHVTGSDLKASEATSRLEERGANVYIGHDKKNLGNAQVVVTSSAVDMNNPEVRAAWERSVPVVPRAEMLAELMRLKWGIAVAGTHGKTSTTALIATILHKAGLDPTMVIGGRVNSLRTNAKLGKGEFLVAEADESDRSFLKLTPTIGVITNVDPEHLEQYEDFAHLKRAFVDFANKVPFYGAVVACSDHEVVRELIPQFQRRCITYGLKDADYVADKIEQRGDLLRFTVLYRGEKLGEAEINTVGCHHALNALAAIAVARECEVPFGRIRDALKTFTGVARRFEIIHREGPLVVDDYAHHPVEIAATVSAARAGWPEKRIFAVVQPHRYSRLKACFDDFVASLEDVDEILIMDVYTAGETSLSTWTGERLCKSLMRKYPQKKISHTPQTTEVMKALAPNCSPQDLVMFLGAGDVTRTAKSFQQSLTSHC